MEAQKVALEKTSGLGQRIDIVLTLIRIGLFFDDQDIISDNLTKAESCVFFNSQQLTYLIETYSPLKIGLSMRGATGTGATV